MIYTFFLLGVLILNQKCYLTFGLKRKVKILTCDSKLILYLNFQLLVMILLPYINTGRMSIQFSLSYLLSRNEFAEMSHKQLSRVFTSKYCSTFIVFSCIFYILVFFLYISARKGAVILCFIVIFSIIINISRQWCITFEFWIFNFLISDFLSTEHWAT